MIRSEHMACQTGALKANHNRFFLIFSAVRNRDRHLPGRKTVCSTNRRNRVDVMVADLSSPASRVVRVKSRAISPRGCVLLGERNQSAERASSWGEASSKAQRFHRCSQRFRGLSRSGKVGGENRRPWGSSAACRDLSLPRFPPLPPPLPPAGHPPRGHRARKSIPRPSEKAQHR